MKAINKPLGGGSAAITAFPPVTGDERVMNSGILLVTRETATQLFSELPPEGRLPDVEERSTPLLAWRCVLERQTGRLRIDWRIEAIHKKPASVLQVLADAGQIGSEAVRADVAIEDGSGGPRRGCRGLSSLLE